MIKLCNPRSKKKFKSPNKNRILNKKIKKERNRPKRKRVAHQVTLIELN
jgi:hypothetical protein